MAMANNGSFHIAALLYRRNKLIRIGINGSKESPEFLRYFSDGTKVYCAHAEMEALQVAKPGDKLIVMRWRKDGTIAIAKPCKYCQQHIKRKKISTVKYTNRQGNFSILGA